MLGRPNVGKSTLLNALVGERLAITSSKPQTTRNNLRGILNEKNSQIVFIDTPGFQLKHKDALNLHMNRNLGRAVSESDLAMFVIEAGH